MEKSGPPALRQPPSHVATNQATCDRIRGSLAACSSADLLCGLTAPRPERSPLTKPHQLENQINDPVPRFPYYTSAPPSKVRVRMVCAKCAKLSSGTKLATPGVKKKSDMYYGSPASSSAGSEKKSATLGQTGVGKVGLACHSFFAEKQLSSLVEQTVVQERQEPICAVLKVRHSAFMPEVNALLTSQSSCEKCKTKVSQGHTYCHACAYQADSKAHMHLSQRS
jgi:cysteine-rich PDZ-binding protein